MSSFIGRPLLPKDSDGPGEPGSSLPPPQPQKREMVRVACQACRERKAKCDGGRPTCSPCLTRRQTCEYDSEAGLDRYTSLKRKVSRLEKDHSELLELFSMIRSLPRLDAHSILDRIRSTHDLSRTLAFIQEGDLLMQGRATGALTPLRKSPRATASAESVLAMLHPLGYPPLLPLDDPDAGLGQKRLSIMMAHPGQGSDITQADIDAAKDLSKGHRFTDKRLYRVKASRWTTVTDDNLVVANLISVYLSWQHSTSRIFDENYFVEQLISGGEEYCSPLLVNAILTVATLNYKAIDPRRSSDLSALFLQETERLWQAELEQSPGGLLIVPASVLLDVWCKANDDEAMGHEYLSWGIQAALDLGLFDNQASDRDLGDAGSRQERKGRAIIAWGLFNWQALDSLVVHRSDRFVESPSVTVPEDLVSTSEDVGEWDSFPLVRPTQVLDRYLALRVLAELCTILQQHIDVRHKAERTVDKMAMVEEAKAVFIKLLGWVDRLPEAMTRSPDCLPVVLDFHMYFHSTVVELFHPFKGVGTSSGSLARDVISASLSQIRHLLYIQRYRYGGPPLTSTILHPIHILTVDLLERLSQADEDEDAESEFYLVLCVDTLMQISTCYPVTKTILSDLIDRAAGLGARLSKEDVAMFRGVDKAFFRKPEENTEEARSHFDLAMEMSITDPSEAVMNWLEKATTELKLG